jgi:hypothetical protein
MPLKGRIPAARPTSRFTNVCGTDHPVVLAYVEEGEGGRSEAVVVKL